MTTTRPSTATPYSVSDNTTVVALRAQGGAGPRERLHLTSRDLTTRVERDPKVASPRLHGFDGGGGATGCREYRGLRHVCSAADAHVRVGDVREQVGSELLRPPARAIARDRLSDDGAGRIGSSGPVPVAYPRRICPTRRPQLPRDLAVFLIANAGLISGNPDSSRGRGDRCFAAPMISKNAAYASVDCSAGRAGQRKHVGDRAPASHRRPRGAERSLSTVGFGASLCSPGRRWPHGRRR